MDIFYALGLNITKKICVKYGQQEDVDKKFTKFDEVVSLIQQALKEPENSGTYEDYSELCKLYDKNSNGTMMVAELDQILSAMGKLYYDVNCIDYEIILRNLPQRSWVSLILKKL